MKHIYPIYNKPSRAILLKFARQTHKSTTLGYKIALPSLKYREYHSLYVAPTGNQVSVFSTDKLNGALRESTVIKEHYFDTKTKDQVSFKELRNGGKIYLRSAFHTADAIRGISADMSCIDEIQDIISDHIPVIEQCMSHSLAKWDHMRTKYPNLPSHLFNNRIYAGTPKTLENTLEKYWEKSTQNEWIIKCTHCGKYNYINEYNIGDYWLMCSKCKKPIHYIDGQWISMNSSGSIDGYRMPQIVLKWINNPDNLEAWKINVIDTRKTYSSEKYYNEVLALSYANAKHPINILELKACCGDYGCIDEETGKNHKMISGLPTYAGIDWGKGDTASGTSYTVLFVGCVIRSVYHTIFVRKYVGKMSEPLLQIEDILKVINRFNCALTIADTGDGRTSNAMLFEKLTSARFGEVYEHGTLKHKIKWDKYKGIYIINRSRVMTDYLMEIKRGLVKFPKEEQFKHYFDDFLGIYTEYSDITRMSKYDHNVPDDSFHAHMFCRLACQIGRGEMSQYLLKAQADSGVGEARSIGYESDRAF
jgi:hypothetical protein